MKDCGEGVLSALCCVLNTGYGEKYHVPFAFLSAFFVFALTFGFGRKF